MTRISRLIPFRARYDAQRILNLDIRCVAASGRFYPNKAHSRFGLWEDGKNLWPCWKWDRFPDQPIRKSITTSTELSRLCTFIFSQRKTVSLRLFTRKQIQSTVKVSNPRSKQPAMNTEDMNVLWRWHYNRLPKFEYSLYRQIVFSELSSSWLPCSRTNLVCKRPPGDLKCTVPFLWLFEMLNKKNLNINLDDLHVNLLT
jgi:hypothetical protein